MEIDFNILWDIGKMAGAGLVAGLFTAFIGIKDHRFKKWWELRVSAYQSVIEALSDLTYAYSVRYKAEIEYRSLSDERSSELSKLTTEAYTRVRKAADSGAFLFSEEANAALDRVRVEWSTDYEMYVESIGGMQQAASQCLKRIVELSKNDLKLEQHIFIWK
ncbi:hypothetical protein [Rugamonas rubra]|uniref:hypothetical protein n=1 Tax=Rugamonas rubra TaxID=758825 RepID=UPI00111352DF|nr:hypothetical protein [Rugamonas rubra]